jgi:hypothetical protein
MARHGHRQSLLKPVKQSTLPVATFKPPVLQSCNRFVQKNRALNLHNEKQGVELLSPPPD